MSNSKIKEQGILLFFLMLLVHTSIAQINTPTNATVPFGSNTTYEHGLMPTNLPSGGTYGQSSEVATIYTQWKSDYVENCGADKARVKFDNPTQTVSEGIAYGMLLAAYAADKDLLDRLWAYYKEFRNMNGVMNWKINGCNSVLSYNGATDAELDAAMALIIAEHQWPGTTSPHNYVNDGKDLINAIKDHETAPEGTFYNGDMWHPDCRNPSYQAPAYARAFKMFMSENGTNQDTYWDNVASGTETLLSNNAHATSGLPTNWSTPEGPPSNFCSGSGTAPDKFGYDACRAPWREGVDLLWWGATATGQIQTVIDRQTDFWISKGGASSVQGSNNVNHDGSGFGDHNGAFTGPTGAMTLASTNTAAHQSLVDDLYTENKKPLMATGYFTKILQMMGLFVQSGNFWNPYGSTEAENIDPTVSLTSPSNNYTICEGSESITISANASDEDGNIDRVEFYEGANLLASDNSSPYSYTWENASSGTKTITAVAYDDKDASTTSSPISVTINATPEAPTVNSPENYCQGEQAFALSATGSNLNWYTSENGGGESNQAPTPNTNNIGNTSYWVSQTNNNCESSRAEIVISIGTATSPPSVTSPITYCEGENAPVLTANGDNLLWYYDATTGNGETTESAPNTDNEGNTNYYVSQTVNGCESERATIEVQILPSPDAPIVENSIVYQLNEIAIPLEATGINLSWYDSENGGIGSTTAPTPATNNEGITSYYVTQTGPACESPRAEIIVTVTDAVLVDRVGTAPVIDGTIDNLWGNITGYELANQIQGNISNDDDLSATFKLVWDNDYFYVLGEITDDALVNDNGAVYQDDAVEIYFDFGNDKATAYANNDFQFTFRWEDNAINVSPAQNSSAGVDFAMESSSTGYVFELRMPWNTLGGTPEVGQLHGFDFQLNDDDNGGARDGKLSWNAATDDAWENPSIFGTVILSDLLTVLDSEVTLETLNVYPNPSKGGFYVSVENDNATYKIISASGKELEAGALSNKQLIGKSLNEGVYILQVIVNDQVHVINLIKD